MIKDSLRYRWLPLAVIAAFLLIEPFVAMTAGLMLALMFFNFDIRPAVRKAALAAVILLGAAFTIQSLLQMGFVLTTCLCCAWLMRRRVFSSFTSTALVSCLAASALVAVLLLVTGPEPWKALEQDVLRFHDSLKEAVSQGQPLEPERLESIESSRKMMVYLLPGQFVLMSLAALFVS
ncbi:MAG: DUF2232 domain-containing protein, partial [Gemmatimonadota bacterium]|nr:DUF2232 domain-containing protein [Gemmatimonadota bacterium]